MLVGKVTGAFEYAGAAGVTIFFVLSGYLITSILLEERSESSHISLGAFYARRILRLVPALVALLVLVPIIESAVHDPQVSGYGGQVLPTIAYFRNLMMATHRWGTILDHTWSLSVEEQFYILWPLVLLLLIKVRRGPTSLMMLTGILAVVAVLWHIVASVTLDGWRVYYAPDTSAYALFVGCALATATARLASTGGINRRSGPWRAIGYACLIVVVIVAVSVTPLVGNSWTVRNLVDVAVAGLAVVLILAASHMSVLVVRPLLWLGKVSYALYLWQGVLLNIHPGGHILHGPQRLVALGLTLLVAEASFRLVERPALRLKKRFQRTAGRSVVSPPIPTALVSEAEAA